MFKTIPKQVKTAKEIVKYFDEGYDNVLLSAPTGCLYGDTKIRLLNGRSVPIEDLVGSKNFYVVSCGEDGQISPGKVKRVWLTKYSEQNVQVTLDNGKVIKCTPDHRFMLRDGSYKEAQYLKPDDPLMPFYLHEKDKRNYIYNPKTNNYNYLAPLIKSFFEERPDESGGKINLHHKDFNSLNDSPDNLVYLTLSEHTSLHLREEYKRDPNNARMQILYKKILNSSSMQREKALKGWYNEDGSKKENRFLEERKRIIERNSTEMMRKRSVIKAEYMRYLENWYTSNVPDYKLNNSLRRGLGNYTQVCKKTKEKYGEKSYLEKHNLSSPDDIDLNHKVRSVKIVNEKVPVYDMEVEKYHNFVVETGRNDGVFVHNSGKSGIAYNVHKLYNKIYGMNSLILNHQKILVDTYDELLSGLKDVVSIKGKSNYECKLTGGTIEDGPCQYLGFCSLKGNCEYYIKRSKLLYFPLGNTNYQLVLSLLDAGVFEREDNELLILDECHNVDEIYTDYCKVEIGKSDIKSLERLIIELASDDSSEQLVSRIKTILGIYSKMKNNDSNAEIFEEFFEEYHTFLINLGDAFPKEKLEYLAETSPNFCRKISRTLFEINNIVGKYQAYKRYKEKIEYIYDEDRDNVEYPEFSLTPLSIYHQFNGFLSRVSKKRLFMSATLNPKLVINELGLDPDKTKFIDVPSDFPIENRKIHFCNTGRLNYQNIRKDSEEMIFMNNFIEALLKSHSENGDSGVIFTPSYKMANLISYGVANRARKLGFTILMNRDGKEKEEVFERFSNIRNKKRLLITPSFTEGVNMKDDMSRFQIIVKMPFKALSSKYIQTKADRDAFWYHNKALLQIIQTCGRSIRSPEDWADTYLLDSNITSMYKRYRKRIPSWFNESVEIF